MSIINVGLADTPHMHTHSTETLPITKLSNRRRPCNCFLPPHVVEKFARHILTNATAQKNFIETTTEELAGVKEVQANCGATLHAKRQAKIKEQKEEKEEIQSLLNLNLNLSLSNLHSPSFGTPRSGLPSSALSTPRSSLRSSLPSSIPPSPCPTISIYDAKGKKNFGEGKKFHKYSSLKPGLAFMTSSSEKEALKAIVATLQLYWEKFKYNSIDGRGIDIKAIVNYGKNFFNAYYDGEKEVFGNLKDDPELGKWVGSFTSDIDVAAHELTHGMTGYKVDLEYEGQSGALNEHMSDVFGIMVKQFALNETVDQSTWKIGDNVLKDVDGKIYALRDMLNPGQGYKDHPILGDDPQQPDFTQYKPLPDSDDNGGVHLYSGPLNRVFALVAKAFGGHSWEKAGVIWYKAYDKLTPKANFVDLAQATIDLAQTNFGTDAATVVKKAWDDAAVWSTRPSQAPVKNTLLVQIPVENTSLEKTEDTLLAKVV